MKIVFAYKISDYIDLKRKHRILLKNILKMKNTKAKANSNIN